MNMKGLYIAAMFALLFVATIATAGDKPAASTPPDQHVLPVLVQVNAKGKITEVTPAIKLQPGLQSLLEKTLGRMITKPAHDAKGKPVASQFIIKLAMQMTKRTDGQMNASFSYVSAESVPAGNWYWIHASQNQELALVTRNNNRIIHAAQRQAAYTHTHLGMTMREVQLHKTYAHMQPGSGN